MTVKKKPVRGATNAGASGTRANIKKTTVYLSERDIKFVKLVGEENLSNGLRIIISRYREESK